MGPFQTDMINLRKLAELSGIPYSTLYNHKVGRAGRKTAIKTDQMKTKVANAAFKELKPFFKELGFDLQIIR